MTMPVFNSEQKIPNADILPSIQEQEKIMPDIAQPVSFSIVIPCHDEASRIMHTLMRVNQVLHAAHLTSTLQEVVLVENGSTDKTLHMLHDSVKKHPTLKIQVYESAIGKGKAIHEGLKHSTGEYVLVMDADNSTDITYILKMFEVLKKRSVDIINTTRRSFDAEVIHNQSFLRRVIGAGFHFFVKIIFKLPVTDTQNGFKLYRRSTVLPLFDKIITSGWVSEVELFALAKRKGLSIEEIPVHWNNDARSTLKIADSLKIFIDICTIIKLYFFSHPSREEKKM